jgi:hypothetical protein
MWNEPSSADGQRAADLPLADAGIVDHRDFKHAVSVDPWFERPRRHQIPSHMAHIQKRYNGRLVSRPPVI